MVIISLSERNKSPKASAQESQVPFSQGDIFTGTNGGRIYHFNASGTLLNTLQTGLSNAIESGMCFDNAGNLRVANFNAGSISEFNKQGVLIQSPWGGPFNGQPTSCVADEEGSIYIYTSEAIGAFTQKLIRKFTADGTIIATYHPEYPTDTSPSFQNGIISMDLSPDHCTMLYTTIPSGAATTGSVKSYNVCTTTQNPDLTTTLPAVGCGDIRVRSNGESIVSCNADIYRLSPQGALLATYRPHDGETHDLSQVSYLLSLDTDNNYFLAGGAFTGNLYRIDTITGDGAINPLFTVPQADPVANTITGLALYGASTPQPSPTVTPTLNLPDFSVETINPIQVVENVDINNDGKVDLVLNKPMVIRVKLLVSHPELLSVQQVKVRMQFQGTQLEKTTSLTALLSNNNIIDFYLTPETTGNSSIIIRIDPENSVVESNENNNQTTKEVTVKETSSISLTYLKVDCKGGLTNYTDTANRGNDYLTALYPLAPTHISKIVTNSSILCGNNFDTNLNLLWLIGMLNNPFSTYFVGVADQNWFDTFVHPHATGTTYCHTALKSVFIRDGYPEALPHEIGHVENIGYPPSDKCPTGYNEGGTSSNGFWVTQQNEITNASSMMGNYNPIGNMWITNGDYTYLFKKFRTNPNDPTILLVSGILYKDGRIEWSPFYSLPQGNISDNQDGNYSIKVLDINNTVLSVNTFDMTFTRTEGGGDVERQAFGLAVGFPQNAYKVELTKNNQIFSSVNPLSSLLRDVIIALPDSAFVKNPSQQRKALLNKVDAFNVQLTKRDKKGAYNNLKNDIRKQINSWILDTYATHSALEYTKPQLLQLVDNLLERLRQ